MIELYLVPIYILLGLLFSTFEGVIYYDPFAKIKFWSRAFFTRVKTTFLDKYFPIDGPHLVKQLMILIISALPLLLKELKLYEYVLFTLINYTALSGTFNICLNYYSNKNKKNER